jgi:hypothetical protein
MGGGNRPGGRASWHFWCNTATSQNLFEDPYHDLCVCVESRAMGASSGRIRAGAPGKFKALGRLGEKPWQR